MKLSTNILNHIQLVLRPFLSVCLVLVLGLILSNCVYRPDVQQGNEITAEMLSQINPGMTRRQVVRILGYPLVTDPFNKNRWDYFYSYKSGKNRTIKSRSAKLIFDGDTLVDVDSDITLEQNELPASE